MEKTEFKKEFIETLKFVLILILVYFIVTLGFQYLPFFNKFDTFAIRTNSMEPVIYVGDVVVTKEIEPDVIKVGDIVAFRVDITNDGINDVVVHYIDEINQHNNQLIFKTKPEISDIQDSWTIEEADIVGIYQFKVNGIGKILLFADSWIGKAIILLDILIVSMIYDYFKKNDKKKKVKKSTKAVDNIILYEDANNVENETAEVDIKLNKEVESGLTEDNEKNKESL